MAVSRLEQAGRSFADVWADKIYPEIQGDYASIMKMVPTRMATKKDKKAYNKARKKAHKDNKSETKAETAEEENGLH